ncbi:MAG: hypothetical protein ACREC6_10750 [Hyphomicrobiaceae bacterium]
MHPKEHDQRHDGHDCGALHQAAENEGRHGGLSRRDMVDFADKADG